jgi:hypothetical protein
VQSLTRGSVQLVKWSTSSGLSNLAGEVSKLEKQKGEEYTLKVVSPKTVTFSC